MPHIYNAPNLPLAKHAFFGRTGGVSKGIFNSLNFNYKGADSPQNLSRNLDIAAAYYGLSGKRIIRLCQNHTSTAIYLNKPSQYEIEADGVVTDKLNLILGITTADCIPVLFADYKNGVIGAAHAGWRGALNGVIKNTVNTMLKHGAKTENIIAATGPCLQKENFFVHDDMRNLFIQQSKDNAIFFTSINNNQYLCDLEQYVKHQLEKLNINNISISGIDTYSNESLYFSYRRFCHLKIIKPGGGFGIELSTICL